MTFYFLVKWIPKIVVDMGYEAALAGSVFVRQATKGQRLEYDGQPIARKLSIKTRPPISIK